MSLAQSADLFALLAMGHFLADFGLQPDRMAVEKCQGCDDTLSWKWWLLSHAAIHALVVAVLTGVIWIGLLEWVLHALIDLAKCRKKYSLFVDQCLHLACKSLWIVLISVSRV